MSAGRIKFADGTDLPLAHAKLEQRRSAVYGHQANVSLVPAGATLELSVGGIDPWYRYNRTAAPGMVYEAMGPWGGRLVGRLQPGEYVTQILDAGTAVRETHYVGD